MSQMIIYGMKRWTDEIAQCIALSGIASGPTEQCLRVTLEDGRIMQVWETVYRTCEEEILFLDGLKTETWHMLGEACGWTGGEIRSHSLNVAHVSSSFMNFRMFRPMRLPPYTFGYGDVKAKVDAALDGDEPDEMVSSQMWNLRRLSYPREQIYEGARIIGECKGASDVAEDQHAAATCSAKYHPEITEDGLMTRSLIKAEKPLRPEPSQLEKEEAALRKKLVRLERRQPQKNNWPAGVLR